MERAVTKGWHDELTRVSDRYLVTTLLCENADRCSNMPIEMVLRAAEVNEGSVVDCRRVRNETRLRSEGATSLCLHFVVT